MLTVHHLGLSASERVVWLCEELDVPYELMRYDRVNRGSAPAEYKALHPAGTAPVISEGDVVLAESGAVIDYIIDRHGGGRLRPPVASPAFPDYLFWFHYANGSLMAAAMMDIAVRMACPPDGTAPQVLLQRLETAYRLAEARIGSVPWFAGDAFTAADIMMLFPLTTMRLFAPRDLGAFPNLSAYIDRACARPAYRRAMAQADPDRPLPSGTV